MCSFSSLPTPSLFRKNCRGRKTPLDFQSARVYNDFSWHYLYNRREIVVANGGKTSVKRVMTFYIPADLDDAMKILRAKLFRSKSEIIRTALRQYLPVLEAEVQEAEREANK